MDGPGSNPASGFTRVVIGTMKDYCLNCLLLCLFLHLNLGYVWLVFPFWVWDFDVWAICIWSYIAEDLWRIKDGEVDYDCSCHWWASTGRRTRWWPWFERSWILQAASEGLVQEPLKRPEWALENVDWNWPIYFSVSSCIYLPDMSIYCI